MPWLTQPIVKWESSPGKIIENRLFLDKFKMIVALRIGDTEKGKSGKSTIINQILSAKHMFSCCGEPGADRGKPFTLNGTVEFLWLTQETSSPKLWESVLQNHYKKGMNELIILANLHGNALDFESQLTILAEIASSYIIFVMPKSKQNLSENWEWLEKVLKLELNSDKISYVAIDPPSDSNQFEDELIIDSSKIADDANLGKLRNVLKSALKLAAKKINFKNLKNFGKMRNAEFIETKESISFIEFIKKETCEVVKRNLSLQKGNKTHEECSEIYAQNDKLQKLIELMFTVLSLDLETRIKAMVHLERELSRQSSKESDIARHEFINALGQLQKTIGAKNEDQVIVRQLKEKVNKALEKIDSVSLGLEHFFREIGKLYEIVLANSPEKNRFSKSAEGFAELLIAGQVIELLDGDSETISGPWLTAICDNVYQRVPKMQVFVISILGLQSSGKSTLLNALFGCKFAVSVGRCTRGLFMRLLFLDENMKKKLNFDAIILIDTEGLGAPEKQNEANAERKDRILATFAMGVSHLTIVNVLGEYMRDLTEILQIAIVAMARLEKADISPDILMVQHLTERNTEKISGASKLFGEALEKAINLSDEKDVNLGVRNSKCLNTLRETIAMGKLFRQFRPFKNGASVYSPPSEEYHQDVVDLYNSIIDIAQKSKYRADFEKWQILVQSYWDSIKSENFMRFKDVKDLQEFLQRGDLISKVKKSIESSIREHSEVLKSFISEQAKNLNEKKVTRESIIKELEEKLKHIPITCPNEPSCDRCDQFISNQAELFAFEEKKPSEHETRLTIHNFIIKTKEFYFKRLSQMLSAKALGQIKSAENLEKIEKRLREELKVKREYTDSDIELIAGKIWHDIEKEAALGVKEVSVIEQIGSEIFAVYNDGPAIIRDFKGNVIKTLKNIPGVDKNIKVAGMHICTREPGFLEKNQAYELEEQLEEISQIILNENNAQNYQTGMIAQLKNKVEQIIIDFEKVNKLKLKTEFKWKLHTFATQKFRIKMCSKQIEWNEQNNPLIVLQKNKSQYMDVIIERLKYGFNYDSDGMIAGNCLLNAIKQKAIKAGNRQRIDDVLEIVWLTNSESVRLKYFSELVNEVKEDIFQRALNHFDDPKNLIENWFRNKIDFSTGKEFDKFSQTFKAEIERVIQDVRNSSSITEIRAYIEKYISSCDEINFPPGLDPDTANDTEVEIYKNRLIEVLNDNNKQINKTSEICFMKPYDDKHVMDRLGCTYACPLCLALCWGQRGHDEDSGETRKHHTCHQPIGLSGVSYKDTKELNADSCHDQRHIQGWYDGDDVVLWETFRKLNRFKNWKFEAHVNNKFNDLMNWFFYKLHESIAKNKGFKPAKPDELKTYCMENLDIGSIMAAINNKI
jgi:GTPase Era involved in 16S rRNA processing